MSLPKNIGLVKCGKAGYSNFLFLKKEYFY